MSQSTKVKKAPMFVGLATSGGAGVGALVGGVVGIILILLVALAGIIDGSALRDASAGLNLTWTLFYSAIAFVVGAICGAVAGALGGFTLGVLFCFFRNRWMGVSGGAVVGALTAVYLCYGTSSFNGMIESGIRVFIFSVTVGGAVAGVLTTRLLFRLLDEDEQTVN